MNAPKPKPDAEGKIPCDCCDHKGMRKRMGTREKYVCDKCHGTKRRVAPYDWPLAPAVKEVDTFKDAVDDLFADLPDEFQQAGMYLFCENIIRRIK